MGKMLMTIIYVVREGVMNRALIIVDVQKCFLPGGSLGVEEGDQIIPVVNKYIRLFKNYGLPIYATRDWHPEVTKHFKEYGGLWPPHCIQGTEGAEFAPDMELPEDVEIISEGMETEGYSAFEGINEQGISFEESLRNRGIEYLYINGIATDYCVKATALDALKKGFRVTILLDAVKGVNLKPEDSQKAIEAMIRAGARVANIKDVEEELFQDR